MVTGQLRTELMLRTICSMARGLCNRDEPAFLQAGNLNVAPQTGYKPIRLLHESRLVGLRHDAAILQACCDTRCVTISTHVD